MRVTVTHPTIECQTTFRCCGIPPSVLLGWDRHFFNGGLTAFLVLMETTRRIFGAYVTGTATAPEG